MDGKRPQLDPALVSEYAERIRQAGTIDHTLYDKYSVKRGLRNADGTGVLVGLTRVGSVHGYVISESEKVPVPGQLFYRGVDVKDLVEGCRAEDRFGYEECAYLLLFGELPSKAQPDEWSATLGSYRRLPDGFKEDAIMRAPGNDVMNSMSRAVLTAFLYDESPDNFSIDNVVRQCIGLISRLPAIAAYSYQAMAHYYQGHSLLIRYPVADMSAAENILMLSKESGRFTRLEAELLDTCLILHAEHGGGNNSAFTTHVMTSAFTDTYSAIAAAILSLRAPRHGGANLRLEGRRRHPRVAQRHPRPQGRRWHGPHLRAGPRGLHPLRPPHGDPPRKGPRAREGEGARRGDGALRAGRAPRPGRGEQPPRQAARNVRERRFLFRVRVRHDRHAT